MGLFDNAFKNDPKYEKKVEAAKPTVTLTFKTPSGVKTTTALPGSPLKEAAARAGAKIMYNCKKGDCGTCEVIGCMAESLAMFESAEIHCYHLGPSQRGQSDKSLLDESAEDRCDDPNEVIGICKNRRIHRSFLSRCYFASSAKSLKEFN
jgi:hypothetical protein